MNKTKNLIAVTDVLLLIPAVLFMTALFVRSIEPNQYEPARTAARLVEWFGARPFLCLDIFLIALPFAVLVVGCVTVLRSWFREAELRQAAAETVAFVRGHLATLLIAAATLTAGGILAIVAVHVITD